MSKQEQKQIETVDFALTIKLPKAWMPVLQGLSELVNLPVEAILLDELYGVLDNFFSGGFFEDWIEYAAEKHGFTEARTKQLEEMIKQVRPY